jgi:DNA-binding NtrC family response regulator
VDRAPRGHAAVTGGPSLERELWSLIDERGLSLAEAVACCECTLIQAALRAEGNNRTRAAGRLGIHVRTIFKKLTHPPYPLPKSPCPIGHGADHDALDEP